MLCLYQNLDKVLNEREKTIIIRRYGLNGKEPVTQSELADRLGISRSYISRIEKKALLKLKKLLEDAKAQIAVEKENALRDIRQTVATLSVGIAEKVMRQKLSDNTEQQQLIERMLDSMK